MALSIFEEEGILLGAGLVGIASNTMGRYREFDITLRSVGMPRGTQVVYETTANIALNFNNMCRKLLANKNLKWLWILGDDHVFRQETLTRLLMRKVDIVSPLCLQRFMPFAPVVYKYLNDDISERVKNGEDVPINSYKQIGWDDIDGKTGMLEVAATGNAGMLIRRNVIEAIGDDWHRVGWQLPEYGASDLYFCKRATEHGFKIHVDLDTPIGHINHMALWPVRDNSNEYTSGIHEAWKVPDSYTAPPIIELLKADKKLEEVLCK